MENEIKIIKEFLKDAMESLKKDFPYFYFQLNKFNFFYIPTTISDHIITTDENKRIAFYKNTIDYIMSVHDKLSKYFNIDIKLTRLFQYFLIHELLHKMLNHNRINFNYAQIPKEIKDIAKDIAVDSILLDIVDKEYFVRYVDNFLSVKLLKKFRLLTTEEIMHILYKYFTTEKIDSDDDVFPRYRLIDKRDLEIYDVTLTDGTLLPTVNTPKEADNSDNKKDDDSPSFLDINEHNKHKINWFYEIYYYIQKWKTTSNNYSGISRRFSYPPQRKKVLNDKVDILFIVDVSSSIGYDNLEILKGELNNLLQIKRLYPQIRISVLEFIDYVVSFTKNIKTIKDFYVADGGETDVRTVFQWVEKNINLFYEKKLLLIFTDGMTPYPKNYPDIPIKWFIFSNNEYAIPNSNNYLLI